MLWRTKYTPLCMCAFIQKRSGADMFSWNPSVRVCVCRGGGRLKSHNSSLKKWAHPPSLTHFSPLQPPGFQWATPQNELITRLSKVTDTIGTGITRGVNTHSLSLKVDNPDFKHAIFLLEREMKGKADKEIPYREEGGIGQGWYNAHIHLDIYVS